MYYPAPTVQFLSALNFGYMVASAGGMLAGIAYWRDVARDSRVVRSDPRATPRDREFVANDLRRERWRLYKQVAVFVSIWLPLLIRPVLRDNPDPYIYEFHRLCLAFVAVGLFSNSYMDLRFRNRFRRGLIPPEPKPDAR